MRISLNNQYEEVENSTCPDLIDHSDTIFNGERVQLSSLITLRDWTVH